MSIQYTHIHNSADFALKRDGKTLFIYFAHSDGSEDWKNNLDFPARVRIQDDQSIWFAHRGFLRVWKSIEEHISADVKNSYVDKVIITGYSHGAALALLCHEYVWSLRPDLREAIKGYGFGCPRVIWGTPAQALQKRWENFTVIRNMDDIVTHLPPHILGYTHVGKLMEIGIRGRYSGTDAHRAENYLAELIEIEKTPFPPLANQ